MDLSLPTLSASRAEFAVRRDRVAAASAGMGPASGQPVASCGNREWARFLESMAPAIAVHIKIVCEPEVEAEASKPRSAFMAENPVLVAIKDPILSKAGAGSRCGQRGGRVLPEAASVLLAEEPTGGDPL